MKLRNIFTMLTAALAFTFVGCEQQEQFLEEVKVSKSYISLPVDGGEVKIEVEAVADWSIVAWDAEAMKEVEIPEWLTVEPASGSKGKAEVVFSAGETTESREVLLHLNCGVACQMLNVVQITEVKEPEISTCKWITENAKDGVIYRAKGIVTLVNASYATYGGFTINDGTADLVIYGSDTKTTYPDLAVGDEVIVDGQWAAKYSNFTNGSQIISLTKSLIKVEKVSPTELAADGDVFTVTLTSKGEGLEIAIPEADQAWLSAGEPLVLGTTVVVELTALANPSTPRTTTVAFSTVSGGKTYTATVDVSQKGSIPLVSVQEAIAMDKDSWVMVSGIVSGVHKKGVVVTDAAGDAIYAYVNPETEDELGAALGDEVTVTGQMGDYANFYQIVNPEIKVVSSGKKPSYPTPVVLETAASFETYKSGKFSSIYVEAKGVTTGEYGDIKIGDWTVSPYQTSATINIADFKDKKVIVKGYILQYKAENALRVMLTSVEIDNIIYKESFAAGIGDYTIKNTNLGTLTSVWSHDAKNKYMKGSGFKGGDGIESWLVSPVYDLAGQTAVYLSFDHILNYLNGGAREDHVNVLVKEDTATEWTTLAGIAWPEGTTWNAVNSGKVDLSVYAGKKIQIAFKYMTADGKATTWEVYNVKLTFD